MKRSIEFAIQKSFVEELCYYEVIRDALFAIPNGGSRHILEAVNLKSMGVTAGVPDLFLAIPSQGFHGMFLECKSPKGKLTDFQEEKIALFLSLGYECKIFKEAKEGIQHVSDYLQVEKLNDFKLPIS